MLGSCEHVDLLYCDETGRMALRAGGSAKVTRSRSNATISITALSRDCDPDSFDFHKKSKCKMERGMMVFEVPRNYKS